MRTGLVFQSGNSRPGLSGCLTRVNVGPLGRDVENKQGEMKL